MIDVLYTQCELKRDRFLQVAWIPKSFAVVGQSLKLRIDGQWQSGWIVQRTYNTVMRKTLPDIHDEVKQHRKNTGDSLPKKKG